MSIFRVDSLPFAGIAISVFEPYLLQMICSKF